ncbi:MAG: hypothetical protein CMB31_07640 [Euryarchaeota archaeon]|nr:hypothetical protein [Euryarchaeota archaeon]
MSWSSSIGNFNELSEDVSPSYITSNNAATADTAINQSAPNNGYSTQQSILMFSSDSMDSRGLFDFNISDTSGNPLPTSFRVTSAHLVLRCSQMTMFGSGRTMYSAASLDASHNLSQSTWNLASTGVNWSVPGADGSSDRGVWEPPFISSSTSVSTTINVTSLVQSSLRSGSTQISLIVSALGVPVNCHTMESSTANFRPNLRIEYAAIGSTSAGSVNITSPQNGLALTLPNTLSLTADTTPTITWADLNGSNVQVQISNESGFLGIHDGDWVWDSWSDSSQFTFSNSTVGSFETPSTNLSAGSDYYARIRSSTSQSILSDWVSVKFLLPDHDITDEVDGSKSFTIRNNSMGYGGTFEDTYITSGNTSFNGGSANNLIVGHSNDTSIGTGVMLLRINIGDIGLHENSSIHEADLVLRRTDRERWPVISVSEFSDNQWTQHGANWTHNGVGTSWDVGTLDGTSYGGVNGNQSSPQLTFDLAPLIRDRLLANSSEPLNLMVQGIGPNGAFVEIGSSEEALEYNPRLEIRYDWGDNILPSSPIDLSPRDRSGSWSVSGANLTSSDTIVVSWNTTGHSGHDVVISTSKDEDFKSTVTRSADSRTDSGFDLAAGTFTFPTNWGLGIGDHIWWRISFIEDGDRSYWSDSMMYVPNLNSTYLSGNDHQIRLADGNASASSSQLNAVPECEDTYLDSTSTSNNNDDSYLVISSNEVALFKCDMAGLILPDGMAIKSAVLRTYAWQFTTFSNVPINVYSGTSDWNETGATWDTRDGTRSWASSGASGTDRISLLDSQTISTTGDDWFEWNITSAAQSANRWGTPLSVIMTSTSGTSASFQDSETGSTGPEIVITYGIGDDSSPDVPIGLNPTGDEWLVSDDLLMAGIVLPEHSWSTPLQNTNAVEIQIDQEISMSSSNLETFQSWVDISAFDLTNGTFTPSSDMTEGERYYWRMRGISSSGQVGNWSATSSYVIPDVVSSMIDSDTSEVEMHHHGYLPDDNLPVFFDTYIDERPTFENVSYASSTSLTLFSPPDIGSGNFNMNDNFSNDRGALFKIPINENLTLPRPNDIRIVGTVLHFNVVSGHGSGVRVYAAAVDPFNESATGRTMDGNTNWSTPHTFGNGNISIHDGVSKQVTNSGSNSINITRLMQLAADRGDDYFYLALTAAQDSYTSTWNGISISSVDASIATDRPYLKIQYRNGSASVPNATGTPDVPSNGQLVWSTSGIMLEPDTSPTLEWLTPTGWNSSWDWILNMVCRGENSFGIPYSIQYEYDSRFDSGFDLTAPSFTFPSSISLAQDSTCEWGLQSVYDDMLGPNSADSPFGVPNDLTSTVDSTHESLTAQNGMAHSEFNLYELVDETYIHSSAPNTNFGQSAAMYVGRFNGFGLVNVDLSQIPLPEPWMSSEASIELYKGGSTTGNHQIAVYNVFDEWDESATWNNASSNTPWSTQSGYLDSTMSPISTTVVNATYGWYSWNITEAVQQARVRGDDIVSLLFRDTSSSTSQNLYFYTSEYPGTNSFSPRINMIYSSGNTWIPEDATSLNPVLGSSTTMWNSTALLPTPPDSVDLSWSHSLTNHSWDFQVDTDPFFGTPDLFNSNANSSLFTTTTGTPSSTSFSFPSSITWDDAWYYWRVRGVENSQYGNWTEGGSFRVPDSVVGTSDGAGNYSVTLERGDVFATSGALPSFPDTYIDSAGGPGQTQNHGTSVSLNVGSSQTAGAIVVTLIEMDLGELPFQSTTLPTGVTLRLHRSNYLGSGAHTVGIHDCGNNTWSEDTVSWSTYIPGTQCSTTASASITRVATGSGTWYEWDITSIARNAFTNQNGRMTLALITNWTGTLYFSSSEASSNNPQLVFDFVDNPNGITPPPQVTLQSPADQSVLFEEDGYLLTSLNRPTLSWNAATGASGYILRLMNETTTLTQRSWIDSGFTGCTTPTICWTPSFDLDTDVLYSWDIQSIAGSIPGARSAAWSFAVGEPETTSLGNHLYSITYGEGEAASVLQYPNIHDSTIDESDPSEVFADRSLEVGIGCGDSSSGPTTTNECRSIVWLDLGQIPLPSNLNPHSGKLRIHLDSVLLADTSYLDVSAHTLLNQNFSEVSSSWDDASYGNAWDSPGMRSGVDYATTPLDTVRIYNTNGNTWVEFDISSAMTSMYGTLGIVLIGTPDTTGGRIVVEFDNSEDSTYHPQLILNYTNVYDIQISGSSTTDADTPVTFSATLLDVAGNTLAGNVAWSSSSLGSISASGVYTPQIAGNEQVVARFGQVTKVLNLTVDHGSPVTLIPDQTTAALNADQSLPVSAIVVDQFGNEVDGETVLWSVTNGSFSSTGDLMVSTTTPSASVVYMPWLTGTQTITVTWGTSVETIPVVVSTGAPHHLVVSGCTVVDAGSTCTYTWIVEDIRFNEMPALQAGTVSWTVDNGNITSAGEFSGDHVGNWTINASSSVGVSGSFNVEVVYGAIGSVILTANTTEITADDSVDFTVIRVDVRGNSNDITETLSVDDWSSLNGTFSQYQSRVIWTAWSKGTQWVEVEVEGQTDRVSISVIDGAPVEMDLRVTGGFSQATAGEILNLRAFVIDQRGNQKPVTPENWLITTPGADQSWIVLDGAAANFYAYTEGGWTVQAALTWTNGVITVPLTASETVTVVAGALADVKIQGSSDYTLTADDSISLSVVAKDMQQNIVQADSLRWYIHDLSVSTPPGECGASLESDEITDEVESTGSWAAGVEGTYRICAIQNGYQDSISATVSHGVAVRIWHVAEKDLMVAGEMVDIQLYAEDSALNQFVIVESSWDDPVIWDIDNENIGSYVFKQTTVGIYELEYVHNGLSEIWTVEVIPSNLDYIVLTADKTEAEQQGILSITAFGYDEWNNAVPLNDPYIVATGHEWKEGTGNQNWEITLISSGSGTITVADQGESASIAINSIGTIPGFFAAGGPLYYAAAGLIGLLILALLVFVVVILRKGSSDDYDDEDDDYDDDEYEEVGGPVTGPSGPVAGPTGPVMEQEEEPEVQPEDDDGVTVDEDGTEWWEDPDDGTWYYRTPDMDDWEVFEE